MSIDRYIQRLKQEKHPEDKQEFIGYVILALENPSAFFAQFDPENQLQVDAHEGAMMVLEEYGMSTAIQYLILHGIHESVSV